MDPPKAKIRKMDQPWSAKPMSEKSKPVQSSSENRRSVESSKEKLEPVKTSSEKPEPVESSSKSSKELPCFVVEDHHDVIPCLYRMIGAKKLPLLSNALVHLDSHPDLLAPRTDADVVWDKNELFPTLSIASWILPAVYAGHFDRIVWLKPPWAQQIPNGHYKFEIGKNKISNEINLTSNLTYFVSESLYSRPESLENRRKVELSVDTLGESFNSNLNYNFKAIAPNRSSYVLDVDLDFFSTRNPFKYLYKNANLYENLKKLYWFEPPDSDDPDVLEAATAARREQIDDLDRLWKHVADVGTEVEPKPTSERWPDVRSIAVSVRKVYSDVALDWEVVHDAGCTWDNTDLPDHVSSKQEIQGLLEVFRVLLEAFDAAPGAVTISRSAEDDYCPVEDVDWIQTEVIAILKKIWPQIVVHDVYLDDD